MSIWSSHRACFHRYSDSFKKPSPKDSGTCESKQKHKYQKFPKFWFFFLITVSGKEWANWRKRILCETRSCLILLCSMIHELGINHIISCRHPVVHTCIRTSLEQPGQRKLQKVNVTLKLRSDRKILTVYTRDSLLHVYHRALEIHLVQNEISSECKTYIVLILVPEKLH